MFHVSFCDAVGVGHQTGALILGGADVQQHVHSRFQNTRHEPCTNTREGARQGEGRASTADPTKRIDHACRGVSRKYTVFSPCSFGARGKFVRQDPGLSRPESERYGLISTECRARSPDFQPEPRRWPCCHFVGPKTARPTGRTDTPVSKWRADRTAAAQRPCNANRFSTTRQRQKKAQPPNSSLDSTKATQGSSGTSSGPLAPETCLHELRRTPEAQPIPAQTPQWAVPTERSTFEHHPPAHRKQ